jgi:L-lactate dehydrogenase
MMKVAIIGGGGLVGSSAAYALQCGAVVREVVLIDANQQLAQGQALDLLHGSTLAGDQRIAAGGYEEIATTDIVVITAGLRRKPDESRLDLINRNVDLFRSILGEMKKAGIKKDAIVHVVSNPVDILTHLAARELGICSDRVIGLGTVLDTIRFRSLLAARLGAAPTQVSALILGEHGDSMVPIWSSATVAALPAEKWPGMTPAVQQEVFAKTKGSGAEVIKLKGGAGFAVGLAIREVVHAIALDTRRVLPVSTVQSGAYGIRGVSLSVPTVVGRAGAGPRIELDLWPKEKHALQQSAGVLAETLGQLGKALSK